MIIIASTFKYMAAGDRDIAPTSPTALSLGRTTVVEEAACGARHARGGLDEGATWILQSSISTYEGCESSQERSGLMVESDVLGLLGGAVRR